MRIEYFYNIDTMMQKLIHRDPARRRARRVLPAFDGKICSYHRRGRDPQPPLGSAAASLAALCSRVPLYRCSVLKNRQKLQHVYTRAALQADKTCVALPPSPYTRDWRTIAVCKVFSSCRKSVDHRRRMRRDSTAAAGLGLTTLHTNSKKMAHLANICSGVVIRLLTENRRNRLND